MFEWTPTVVHPHPVGGVDEHAVVVALVPPFHPRMRTL